MKKILVTGSAGFIGFHLAKGLLESGFDVVGIDNLNDYYDPQLKLDRLENLNAFVSEKNLQDSYQFTKLDISDEYALKDLFNQHDFDIVVNLAAQAGVRYSLENPNAYIVSNLVGYANILECCRHASIEHFIFASSSSVYGMNTKQPFSTSDNTDFPISLYAATKKSNELLAHSYSHLFQLPCTGLRFFTVYGPYGRPDMAYYSFTKAIHEGRSIDVFNHGDMKRDFTYIDDIVDGILKVVHKVPAPIERASTNALAPFRVFNIGNNNPVSLSRFIEAIEAAMSKPAVKNMLPMQSGDVPVTYADIDNLVDEYGFHPSTSIEQGISKFVEWYLKTSSL
ncbi:NAD-dependent epimerase [Gammaproteobacteria bacterium]|nr:NAD-dependent epimerase [Gammaproteobacteria bacterium]